MMVQIAQVLDKKNSLKLLLLECGICVRKSKYYLYIWFFTD